MAPVDSGGPVRPAAADTITTYTLPASPPKDQTLTHAYLAFHTWLTTKMGDRHPCYDYSYTSIHAFAKT